MTDQPTTTTIEPTHHPTTRDTSPLTFNPDDYQDALASWDATEEEKSEFLQALWNIMGAFVDIGWGVDNIQLFFPELFEEVAPDSTNLVDSKRTPNTKQDAPTKTRGQ